jgi:hypothetical protein
MDNATPSSQSNRIAGTWKHCDGFSDVEFSFSVVDGSVAVSVLDTSDGESPVGGASRPISEPNLYWIF